MEKIGNLIHRQFKQEPKKETPALCRFDLVVRWPEHVKRRQHIFTYRGDHYEKDPQRMLWGLLRYFLRSYPQWLFCQIRDNTKAANDPTRIIFWFNNKDGIINNCLSEYNEMLKDHPVPDWLKSNV